MKTAINTKLKLNAQLFQSLLAVLLGLIAGGILITLTGNNPFVAYDYLVKGGTMTIKRFGNMLGTATPLVFSGLAVAFAFRTGLFNIGTPGQMFFGGLCATFVSLRVPGAQYVVVPLAVLAAMLGGALWASVPGLLKAKFNVNEVVSAIMMNWACYWVVYYFVPAFLKGPSLETESARIAETASLRVPWLTELFNKSFVNIGFLLALVAVAIIWFILNKTTLGFKLKAVGFNRHAAEYSGIAVNRSIVTAMLISGALAGLGGATLYIGNLSNLQIDRLPSQGFDGIAVALLGANHPIGVLLSALFFGLLHIGKGYMNANINVPPEIADTIIAVIIYFAATSMLFKRIFDWVADKKKRRS